jgi:hypothetical protein
LINIESWISRVLDFLKNPLSDDRGATTERAVA